MLMDRRKDAKWKMYITEITRLGGKKPGFLYQCPVIFKF